MNSLDLALVVIIGLAAWGGWKKGLFVEVASLIGVVAGVFGAIYFSGYAGNWLENSFDWEQKYINLSAFAITFLIIVVAIQMAGKVLTKIADFAALGILNKLLGAVFGGLKMVFILSVALMWFNNWGMSGFILTEERKEDSILYANIEPIAPAILPDLIEDAKQIIDDTKEDLRLNEEN
ncbi:CvpA family protein [Gilvibacter sediminis]|uniref:CvpA family protein n=1 Tax=Gilvibacter sediminis TaxID=379071 RepID=UPI0023509591|nr:CvpA family protein [Gilvibacter sediminis]MDC7996993.1 CvpA family protein [Gilvibacter sediminis]